MCILVSLWWHLVILEKLAAWAYLNTTGWQLWQILSNKLDFLHDADCWCGFVYARSVSGTPASSCDSRLLGVVASWLQGGVSVLQGFLHLSSRAWRSSAWFWGGLSIIVIVWPNSTQICSMGLRSGDLASCSILVTLPCVRKSRTAQARWGVALSSW